MPSDRIKVLAWLIEESLRCNECGTRADEHEDVLAYVAEAVRCIGCEKIAVEQKIRFDEPGSTDGLKYHLVKTADSLHSDPEQV